MVDFQLKSKDLAARIGKLRTSHGIIETPTILPVINPNKALIPSKEIEKYGAQAVITNSYILWKDFHEESLGKGVHKLIGFDGPVMTDSGGYQLMEYGGIEVNNQEIIDFQHKIGVDIGVILDTPTASKEEQEVRKCVEETIKRAKESELPKGTLWCGPVQGSVCPPQVRKCAKAMASLPFDIHAIGSVVPLLMNYEFSKVMEATAIAKENLPLDRPVHLFGAGHPMFFSLAVALGVDIFDSAAYALYAADNRYITQQGTTRLEKLDYLPCSCPVCSKHSPKELDEKLLAEHNLYVTFEELRLVKQAIRQGSLWELIEQRSLNHPALVVAFKQMMKHKRFINQLDPITKEHFFYLSSNSKNRSEVARAKKRATSVTGKKERLPVFGSVPAAVLDCYPFSQSVFPGEFTMPRKPKAEERVRAASKYWLGLDVFPEAIEIERSRRTNRIRAVYTGNKLLATFRASDFMILLHDATREFHARTKYPSRRFIVEDKEVQRLIRQGGTVFAKFVHEAGEVLAGEPVLIVTPEDELLASGEALMASKEAIIFSKGPAVSTRWVNAP